LPPQKRRSTGKEGGKRTKGSTPTSSVNSWEGKSTIGAAKKVGNPANLTKKRESIKLHASNGEYALGGGGISYKKDKRRPHRKKAHRRMIRKKLVGETSPLSTLSSREGHQANSHKWNSPSREKKIEPSMGAKRGSQVVACRPSNVLWQAMSRKS